MISYSGIDFKRKVVNIKGDSVKINLWDTAGHQDYRMVTANFLKGCSAIILVSDSTKLSSTADLELWKDTIKDYATDSTPVFLLANKADLLKDDDIPKAFEIINNHKLAFGFTNCFLVVLLLTRYLPRLGLM